MGYLLDGLEKTAAPMFGKKRYKPRKTKDDLTRYINESNLAKYKNYSADPTYRSGDEERADDSIAEVRRRLTDERKKALPKKLTATTALALGYGAGAKFKAGNKKLAKNLAIAGGLASAYPIGAATLSSLKSRYKYSKDHNVAADKAERLKDQAAKDNFVNYVSKHNPDGMVGWHTAYGATNGYEIGLQRDEARKAGDRVLFNEDTSTQFRNKDGKKTMKYWYRTGYEDDDYDPYEDGKKYFTDKELEEIRRKNTIRESR